MSSRTALPTRMSRAPRISALWRYPIKSFQGESIPTTAIGEGGIFADRTLALLDKTTGKVLSGKHARLGEKVLTFRARYESEPVAGQALPPVIAEIDGETVRTDDVASFNARCSEVLGADVELSGAGTPALYETFWPEVEGLALNGNVEFPLPLAESGSFADLEPLHLLTTASLHHLSDRMPESQIATERFRPGILIDTGDASGFVENDWVERTASLGSAKLTFGAAAPRCVMTTRPQAGLPRDPAVLRTLARENRREFMGLQMACLGIYARVTTPGTIAVGDELRFD